MNLKNVTAAKAYAYDMVFRNVEIYDGSGQDGFVADVGIKDGKIVAVGRDLELGRAEKDCRGLCLAPGFVDVHTHSDYQMFVDQSRLCKLMQGVTFEIGGQCGWSRGVVTEDIERVSYTDPFAPNRGIEAVFVLGQAAVVNNIPTGVCNGRVYKTER